MRPKRSWPGWETKPWFFSTNRCPVAESQNEAGGIDRALVRRFMRVPMTAAEWKPLVREHQRFVQSTRGFHKWTVLSVSGLPLAVCDGPKGERGEQLNLRMADLTQLKLRFAKLPKAALVGVMAEGVSFRGATLVQSVMTDSWMDAADFSLAKMSDVDLSRTSLRGARFNKAVLNDADFQGCDLTGADFTGASLTGASFHEAVLEGVRGFTLPIFGGDPAEDLEAIFGHFSGWRLQQQFEEFTLRHDGPTLWRCLLDSLKRNPAYFGQDNQTWQPLASADAASALTGDDFMRLASAIAAGAPSGWIVHEGGSTGLWGDGDIPGRLYELHRIVVAKDAAVDTAFFDAVVARRSELPELYAGGLASSLAEVGRLALDEVPSEARERVEAARASREIGV